MSPRPEVLRRKPRPLVLSEAADCGEKSAPVEVVVVVVLGEGCGQECLRRQRARNPATLLALRSGRDFARAIGLRQMMSQSA